jgi:hypothetical protein
MVMKVLRNAAELPAEALVGPASEDEPEVAFADGTEASADVAVPAVVAEAADLHLRLRRSARWSGSRSRRHRTGLRTGLRSIETVRSRTVVNRISRWRRCSRSRNWCCWSGSRCRLGRSIIVPVKFRTGRTGFNGPAGNIVIARYIIRTIDVVPVYRSARHIVIRTAIVIPVYVVPVYVVPVWNVIRTAIIVPVYTYCSTWRIRSVEIVPVIVITVTIGDRTT